ncbi:hypothetical protein EYC98_08140 [Halieaceae bacterium IMCC14734]|uniref:PEP-CTERM sorting domain-containing protein n=1 Tax=Candidatus Litorirhabdus singularis TaxID=2518993 RepID=A0ABT3TF15_9GAMM|nr:hypothetical protein [Candidatus Litorirhabdus singularis]MCX2980844.1 hypothetical protein [Candidatus Litorirhabdus singularis]
MKKCRLLLVGISLFFVVGTSSAVWAAVLSGPLDSRENTTYSFGDGTHNLNIKWVLPGSTGIILGPNNRNTLYPGTSDALLSNLGFSVDIDTLDTEAAVAASAPYAWADLSRNFVPGQWIAFKGLNGYYGVWHIERAIDWDSNFGLPGKIAGIWYFQDDGTSSFVSNVPVPGAIWLFGSAIIGLVGMAKRKQA